MNYSKDSAQMVSILQEGEFCNVIDSGNNLLKYDIPTHLA